MKKHSLNPEEKGQILEEIASYLSSRRKEVVVAYVFGSFLNQRAFADIDLGMVTQEILTKPLEFELDLETRLQNLIQYPFDVRVLNKAPISFSQNVIRYGKVILDRDPNLRADFEGKVLKLYFDFRPFRRQYLSEVVNAPI